MSQVLITEAMLDEAAAALKPHRVQRGKCTCGATMPVARHHAEVVADAIAPALVAEIMTLLTAVTAADTAAATSALNAPAERSAEDTVTAA